jgi:hypothetical protein
MMRRRRSRASLAAVALAALAVGLLTGCGGDGGDGHGGGEAERGSPAAAEGDARSWNLSTHCGIEWIVVDGTWYQAERRLSNGSGSPPEGWDDPVQKGLLTVTETKAIFTDDSGHEVSFLPRPGQTSSPVGCD